MKQLFYLLESSVTPGGCLVEACDFILSVHLGECLADGRFTGRRYTAADLESDEVRPQDRFILQLLQPGTGSGYYLLRGAEGVTRLQCCLATGRCYFGDFSTAPLAESGEPALEPAWQTRTQGDQVLALRSEPGLVISLSLDPPCYLDGSSGDCGALGHVSSLAQLHHLAERGAVPPEQVRELNRGWREQWPESELPPVTEYALCQQPLTATGAHLVLESDRERAHARLRFRINHTAVCDPLPDEMPATVRYLQGHAICEVTRDPTHEEQLHQWLKAVLPAGSDRQDWLRFVQQRLPELQANGWEVEQMEDFPYRLVEAGSWYGRVTQESPADEPMDWFSLELGVLLDGERINLLPVLASLLQQGGARVPADLEVGGQLMLPLDDGRYLPVARQRIDLILDTLVELFEENCLGPAQCMELPASHLYRLLQLEQALELDDGGDFAWEGEPWLQSRLQQLSDFEGIEPVSPPPDFAAQLRPYQGQGLAWMQFLRRYQLGGILADDMGLGKTVQTLGHLAVEKYEGRLQAPSLIVAPTSLMGNWQQEAAKFAPGLKVLTLHGSDRSRRFEQIDHADVVLTTYPLLKFDEEVLLHRDYYLLILDEAQAIKNPRSRASRLVREIRARHRLCLSGTPLENHLGELWSLFDFLMPGFLGTEQAFQRLYRQPIEREDSELRRSGLARRVAPFILRRTKETVATELPDKTEVLYKVTLGDVQRDLYESIRLAMQAQVQQVISDQGFDRSRIAVLDALLKLRQVCCDPRLVKLEAAAGITDSAKLDVLLEMLPEMVEEGRRILLFSQFTSMLALIRGAVEALGISCLSLTGSSRNRGELVARFQAGEAPLFLISLKAGGTGLNLTAADTVIHYDPWWNPAAEQQATDRAHRIGQDKPVFVYKLCAEGSVEEKILELQQRKQALVSGMLGSGYDAAALRREDLEVLFAPLEASSKPLGALS